MNFTKLQEKVLANAERYSKKHGVKFEENFCALKLVEEVGEFTQALLIHQKNVELLKL